jgi:hypothetical protein
MPQPDGSVPHRSFPANHLHIGREADEVAAVGDDLRADPHQSSPAGSSAPARAVKLSASSISRNASRPASEVTHELLDTWRGDGLTDGEHSRLGGVKLQGSDVRGAVSFAFLSEVRSQVPIRQMSV